MTYISVARSSWSQSLQFLPTGRSVVTLLQNPGFLVDGNVSASYLDPISFSGNRFYVSTVRAAPLSPFSKQRVVVQPRRT